MSLESNAQAILTLDPSVQPIVTDLMNECFRLNRQFNISQAGRTQAYQNRLFLQDRMTEKVFADELKAGVYDKSTYDRGIALFRANGGGIPGPRVTWTLDSLHVNGLAIDILPINCGYILIEEIAAEYGIYRPDETLKLGDYGHFALDRCHPKASQRQFIADPHAMIRKLERLIVMAGNAFVEARLKKRLDSYRKSLSQPPNGNR